jgi:hypothetical protein
MLLILIWEVFGSTAAEKPAALRFRDFFLSPSTKIPVQYLKLGQMYFPGLHL